MSLHTLNDILMAVYKSRRDRVMLQKLALGWTPISSTEIYRSVVGISRVLESWGIGKGDRVAILSENRPEWTITDFAALALGAVTVPIYSTQTAGQTSYILNDAGVRVIAVSTKSQLEKVLTIQAHARGADHGDGCGRNRARVPYVGPDAAGPGRFDPESGDPDFDARLWTVRPDDLATIIYTSGTTGAPKGSDADPWKHGVKHRVLNGRIWLRNGGRIDRLFLAAFSCHCPARGFRAALSWRGAGVLSRHCASGSGFGRSAAQHLYRRTARIREDPAASGP